MHSKWQTTGKEFSTTLCHDIESNRWLVDGIQLMFPQGEIFKLEHFLFKNCPRLLMAYISRLMCEIFKLVIYRLYFMLFLTKETRFNDFPRPKTQLMGEWIFKMFVKRD